VDDYKTAENIVANAEWRFQHRFKGDPMPEELIPEEPKEPFSEIEDRRLREALVEHVPMLNNVAINVRIQKVIGTLAEYAYNQYLELHKKKVKA
jgi:hypothetical protein